VIRTMSQSLGESAGGLNTPTHIASPLTAGLFQRIQSGAYQLNAPNLSASEALGAMFANAVGCTDQSAACLRSRSVDSLLANAIIAFNQSTVDGQVLRETQLSALLSGRINPVALIQGANSHEGRSLFRRL
jgi:para-nitrobenzyl esterase